MTQHVLECYFNGFEVLEVTGGSGDDTSTPTTCFRPRCMAGRGHLDGESFNPEPNCTIAPSETLSGIERMHLTLGLGSTRWRRR
jgi:hypothetical protein